MVFGVGFAFVFKSVCTCVGGDILGGEEFLLCMQSMGGFERIKFKRIQRNFESGNLT